MKTASINKDEINSLMEELLGSSMWFESEPTLMEALGETYDQLSDELRPILTAPGSGFKTATMDPIKIWAITERLHAILYPGDHGIGGIDSGETADSESEADSMDEDTKVWDSLGTLYDNLMETLRPLLDDEAIATVN